MCTDSAVCKDRKSVTVHALYKFKGNKGGEWIHGAELIADLVIGRTALMDDGLQKELLDWIFTDSKNVFRNRRTKELVFTLAAKRGNSVYAAKKNVLLNEIIAALSDMEFDFEVPGLRGLKYRLTRIIFGTLTFSHKRYIAEQAWGLL